MINSVHRRFKPAPLGCGLLAALFFMGTALAATPWQTDTKESTLNFSGTQAGAPFKGAFDSFTAQIAFDPKDLATSRFDVAVDVKSANSKDQERDDAIRSSDFFDAKRWPSAHFVAERFTDKGAGKFSATGKLTIRDVTRDASIDFTFVSDASGAWLRGGTSIKRLDFNVGQGDWKDTMWVGNDVGITFAVRLHKAS